MSIILPAPKRILVRANDYTRFQPSLHAESFIADGLTRVKPTPAHHPHIVHTHSGEASPVVSGSAHATGFESWLPFCAPHYNISPNPTDYLFRPVVIMITDLPNRNGVGFPASELAKWSEQGGCQAYKTWIGKPLHSEHGTWHPDPQNPDPKLAIGVVVDAVMKPLIGYGENKLWKVLLLCAVDKTKDVKRAKDIESGRLNTWSMGALVGHYTCSYCGGVVGEKCDHIDPDEPVVMYRIGKELVYRLCADIFAVENSSVNDPAYGVAASDVDHIAY